MGISTKANKKRHANTVKKKETIFMQNVALGPFITLDLRF